jgi:hypothetical protein
MRRALAIGINVVLASLAVLCLVLWAASHRYCHRVYVGHDGGTSGGGIDLRSTPGALECIGITFESEPGRSAEGWNSYFTADAWSEIPNTIRHQEWVRRGFGAHRWQQLPSDRIAGPKYTNSYVGIAVPFWLLAVLFAMPPAVRWMPGGRRRRRLAAGLCTSCGYDCRATPERCPECGAAPRGDIASRPRPR